LKYITLSQRLREIKKYTITLVLERDGNEIHKLEYSGKIQKSCFLHQTMHRFKLCLGLILYVMLCYNSDGMLVKATSCNCEVQDNKMKVLEDKLEKQELVNSDLKEMITTQQNTLNSLLQAVGILNYFLNL